MTKIRCYYLDCQFLDDRYCAAAAVDIKPEGCLTYSPVEDEVDITDWDDDEWDEDEGEDTESLWEVEEEEDELDDEEE